MWSYKPDEVVRKEPISWDNCVTIKLPANWSLVATLLEQLVAGWTEGERLVRATCTKQQRSGPTCIDSSTSLDHFMDKQRMSFNYKMVESINFLRNILRRRHSKCIKTRLPFYHFHWKCFRLHFFTKNQFFYLKKNYFNEMPQI